MTQETNTLKFGRMIPAMVTPMDDRLDVDFEKCEELALRLADEGADALVLVGTTGESPTITLEDKLQLFSCVKKALAGRIPIIANVGNYNTAESVEFAKLAEISGVDGLMCVVPYYNKPPQEGLYQHFAAIAKATSLPIVLYNIPGRCSVNMTAETTLRLARDFDNIVAVKEASGDYEQVAAIIKDAPEGFAVYSGDDSATLKIMQMGGAGVISTTGNVAPALMKQLTVEAAAGNFEKAQEVHDFLAPLMSGLFATSNPILAKAALELLGFAAGGVRLPLIPATEEQIATLADILKQVELL